MLGVCVLSHHGQALAGQSQPGRSWKALEVVVGGSPGGSPASVPQHVGPADDAQGPMEGPFVFLFFSPKNCNTNIGISCFPNLRTRALLSKQSAELDLGAPHRSKSPPEEGDKERDLGRGWGGPPASESNTQNKIRGSRKRWQNTRSQLLSSESPKPAAPRCLSVLQARPLPDCLEEGAMAFLRPSFWE